MTDFAINVKLNANDAIGGAQSLTKSLGAAKVAAKGFDDAIHKALATSPWEQGIREASSMKRTVDGLSAASKAFAGIGEQVQRETEFLQELRRPLEEYTRDIATLNSLYSQGKITTEEYGKEQNRLNQIMDHGKESSSDATLKYLKFKEVMSNLPGPIGGAANQVSIFSSGVGGMTTVVAGAIVVLLSLGESYINLANDAQKFTSAAQNVDAVLQEQLELSYLLHSSLHDTMELYDAVRDATDELNMSHEQQIRLTKSVGASVIGSGKALSEAQGIMTKLTYAISAGSISAGDLKTIFKQLPDVAAGFVEVTGKSRKELLALAQAGKFSGDLLIQMFNAIGPAMQDKVTKKVETGIQAWTHFKDELVLTAGKAVQSTGAFDGLKVIIVLVTDVAIGLVIVLGAVGTALKAVWDALKAVWDALKAVWDAGAWLLDGMDFSNMDALKEKMTGIKKEVTSTGKAITEQTGNLKDNKAAVNGVKVAIETLGVFEQHLKEDMESLDPVLVASTKLYKDHIDKLAEAKTNLDAYNVALSPTVLKYYGASQKQVADLTLGQAKASIEAANADKTYGEVVTRVKVAELERADAMRQVKDAFAAHKISAKEYREEMEQFNQSGDGMFGKRNLQKTVKVSYESDRSLDAHNYDDVDYFDAEQENLRRAVALRGVMQEGWLGRAGTEVMETQFDAVQRNWEQTITLAEQHQNQLDSIKQHVIEVVKAYDDWTSQSTDAVDGLNRALQQIKKQADDTGSQIETLALDTYGNLEDTIMSFIETGKLEWEGFVMQILKDIEKILLRKALVGIGSAIGGIGFASGGSFTVGGAGGTDSQMVAFRASPGERVSVSTPSQQAKKSENSRSGDVHLRSVNVYDQSEALRVLGSPAGERVVLNVIKKHSGIVRSATNRK